MRMVSSLMPMGMSLIGVPARVTDIVAVSSTRSADTQHVPTQRASVPAKQRADARVEFADLEGFD